MAKKSTKEYTGSVYIGVTGADHEYGEARDTIDVLARNRMDEGPIFGRATKGYEARQYHLKHWYEDTSHPFALFLDSDMVFPADTLERLRSHKLPYVSGLYMRRRFAPVAPVWYRPYAGQFPMEPWIGDPERGKLHPIGASGWGCILMHRDVVTAVKALLKGEWEVIEDDMDVWPYDLRRIMGAIAGLREIARTQPEPSIAYPALVHHTSILESEIRPLRADNEVVGSDIRFPFFALQAGYQLMGDPDVRPKHIVDYPLSPDDYSGMTPEDQEEHRKEIAKNVARQRSKLRKHRVELGK